MDKNEAPRVLKDKVLGKVTGGFSHNEKYFVTDICSGCKACADECIVNCISFARGYAVIDRDSCIQCGFCAHVCPTGAIIRI